MLTRWLWPVAIVVPLLIGAASWMAYSAGMFSEWGGITIMIVAMITLLAGSTVWSAQRIDRSDAERRQAESVAAPKRGGVARGATSGADGQLVVGSRDRHRHMVRRVVSHCGPRPQDAASGPGEQSASTPRRASRD